MDTISQRLKRVRKILNKSQEDLARDLNITKQAISNMEHSKSSPSIALLTKLLTDYGININYIVAGVGEIFLASEKSYTTLRSSLMKEVEQLLDSRGIS